MGGAGELAVRVAHTLHDPGGAVSRDIRVHARTALGAGSLEVDHGWQRFVVDDDQPRGVLGEISIVGHHDRDQLAAVTDVLDRERQRRTGIRELRMGNEERRGLVQRAEVHSREHQVDAPLRSCT